jgi:preprotein translocase subunit SecA
METLAEKIVKQSATLTHLDDWELRARANALRPRLARARLDDAATIQALSCVAEAARRILGMDITPPILKTGLTLLTGVVIEDRELGAGAAEVTGVMAAILALAGVPVHVICRDSNLAESEMQSASQLFLALGMTVGLVTNAMSEDARSAAYRSPVVYCDYRQLAADYLCDQAALKGPTGIRQRFRQLSTEAAVHGDLLLPGLIWGIVSDPDSILIDAANEFVDTPSRTPSYDDRRKFGTALNLASRLSAPADYNLRRNGSEVELTAAGNQHIAARALELGGLWYRPLRRDEVVRLAIIALFGCERGRHYHVDDGLIRLSSDFIEESRLCEERRQDLVQLLSIKEGCELRASGGNVTLSYRRFFRRYLRVAGFSPVASLLRHEFAVQYGIPVVTFHRSGHKPITSNAAALYCTPEDKSTALVDAVRTATADMKQVLVLCNSVDAAAAVATTLQDANIDVLLVGGQDSAGDALNLAAALSTGIVSILTHCPGTVMPEQEDRRPEFHIIVAQLCGNIQQQKLVAACGQHFSRQQQLVALDEPLMRAVAGKLELFLVQNYLMTGGTMRAHAVIFWLRRKALRVDNLKTRSRQDLQEFNDRLDQQLIFSTGTK